MKTKFIILLMFISSIAVGDEFASPSEPSGVLVMDHAQVTKKQFPVSLVEVNGKNVDSRSQTAWLKPGAYELSFRSTVDVGYTNSRTRQSHRNTNRKTNNTLKVNIEAGKSYYVALDASSNNTTDWQPVVYAVK